MATVLVAEELAKSEVAGIVESRLNFRLTIFSMVSASNLASPSALRSAFNFLCSATTLSLDSSRTQSSRRSTVSGIITRRYCGGP